MTLVTSAHILLTPIPPFCGHDEEMLSGHVPVRKRMWRLVHTRPVHQNQTGRSRQRRGWGATQQKSQDCPKPLACLHGALSFLLPVVRFHPMQCPRADLSPEKHILHFVGRVGMILSRWAALCQSCPLPSTVSRSCKFHTADLNSFNSRTDLVAISGLHFGMNRFLIISVVEKTWMVTRRDYVGKGTRAMSSVLLRTFRYPRRSVVQPQGCVDGTRTLVSKLVLPGLDARRASG